MWDKWREASEGAVSRWRDVVTEIAPQPSDPALERYVREHRDNWSATRRFAETRVGPMRADSEAQRYVQAMEQRLRGR